MGLFNLHGSEAWKVHFLLSQYLHLTEIGPYETFPSLSYPFYMLFQESLPSEKIKLYRSFPHKLKYRSASS